MQAATYPQADCAPGAQVEIDSYLTLQDPLPAGIAIQNFAELSDATDENGDDQIDDDSTPDENDGNDVFNNDNDVSGNGNDGEDEDDHDVAVVTTEVFDLASMKLLARVESLSRVYGSLPHPSRDRPGNYSS